jgi:hypothetical protein
MTFQKGDRVRVAVDTITPSNLGKEGRVLGSSRNKLRPVRIRVQTSGSAVMELDYKVEELELLESANSLKDDGIVRRLELQVLEETGAGWDRHSLSISEHSDKPPGTAYLMLGKYGETIGVYLQPKEIDQVIRTLTDIRDRGFIR